MQKCTAFTRLRLWRHAASARDAVAWVDHYAALGYPDVGDMLDQLAYDHARRAATIVLDAKAFGHGRDRAEEFDACLTKAEAHRMREEERRKKENG